MMILAAGISRRSVTATSSPLAPPGILMSRRIMSGRSSFCFDQCLSAVTCFACTPSTRAGTTVAVLHHAGPLHCRLRSGICIDLATRCAIQREWASVRNSRIGNRGGPKRKCDGDFRAVGTGLNIEVASQVADSLPHPRYPHTRTLIANRGESFFGYARAIILNI